MTFTSLVRLVQEGSAVRDYSCLMLDCSFLSSQITEHFHKMIDEDDVYDDEPGHGLELEPHVTVLYGLHTEKFSDILTNVSLKPCKFSFKNISLFQNEKYDVLKFDVKSSDLISLNKEVASNLSHTTSYPNYHPHCTIAYLKPGTGKKYLKIKCNLIGKSYTGNLFVFSDKSSNKIWHRV